MSDLFIKPLRVHKVSKPAVAGEAPRVEIYIIDRARSPVAKVISGVGDHSERLAQRIVDAINNEERGHE